MAYVVKLTAPAERELLIAKSVKTPIATAAFYDFRSAKFELPVIRIDIGIPVYRMENFRTYTDQKEYIAKEKKAANFFSNGQELESVQQVQHDLLVRLARKSVAESVVPVIDVLEAEGQREAILVTSSGVVVNGNRRLAAMRELGTAHVDVMVLPADATADEIVDIEASLQGKPETKLDYDWIGDGQLISRLVGMGRTTKQVADQLRRGEKDVRTSIQALSEAELYLKEWAHAEGEYSRIREDAEQFFKDLAKALDGKPASEAQASRVIAWSLFDNRDKLPGRIYNFNAAFGKLASNVLDRVATDLGLSTEGDDGELQDDEKQEGAPTLQGEDADESAAAPAGDGPVEDSDSSSQIDVSGTAADDSDFDDFSIDVDEEDSATSYDAVIEALKDEKSKEDAIEALIDAAESVIEMEKGQKSGQAALKALAQANGKIASVDMTRAAPDTYAKIAKQLDAIEAQCEAIRAKLKELE